MASSFVDRPASAVLAVAAGYAADRAGVPLAWVLGPLVVAAGFAMSDRSPFAPTGLRRAGQLVIGASIGVKMTAAAVANLAAWLPLMIATAAVSILLAAAVSVALARYGRIDEKTAYFAMLPGGLSEMANVGAAQGARSEAIALSHALRVALAVLVMPALVVAVGHQGHVVNAHADMLSLPRTAALLAGCLVGVQAMRLVRLNNPWMLGSLVAAAVLAGSGLVDGYLARPLVHAGQVFVGVAIGARFKRDIVEKLFRLTVVSGLLTLALGALLFGVAGLIAAVTPIDLASAALAASPGGFAEMAITAEVLSLDVTLVVAFHVARAFMVNGLATQALALLSRIGYFDAVRRLLP